jgi:hypothetical protein
VPGAHVSRVVMTDFMQLVPYGTAELSVTPDSATITVSGISGRSTFDQISESRFA